MKKSTATHLKKTYGLSPAEYVDLVLQQGNLCKICGKPETIKDRVDLSIDHCHSTGKVRGLLCQRCNFGLGMFKDNVEYLSNAIDYLIESQIVEEIVKTEPIKESKEKIYKEVKKENYLSIRI